MAENDKTTMLKVVLIIVAVVSIVYGVGFLFVPGVWVKISGGNPVDYGWLRWPGGVIIALGIGSLMVARKPEKQGIFVFTSALATLLAGLGMLYSWIMREGTGTIMFHAFSTILLLVLSGLLWWGRGRAKGIL
jgi:hypothetical protein